MTQPPDEPTPDDAWQPPGPQPPPPPPPAGQYPAYGPPYDRPPPAQNPYGGDTTSYYQPIDSGGMSSTVKVVLGMVIGVLAGFFLWIMAAILFSAGGTGSDTDFLFFAAVAPLLVPAPLLIWQATRPWAVGLLMGTAISSIGMSGLCASLINSL
jgi:hypothetical protein